MFNITSVTLTFKVKFRFPHGGAKLWGVLVAEGVII